MEIRFFDQLKTFRTNSVGRLDSLERLTYLDLMFIWNDLRRPQGWFNVSYTQLMRECGIKTRATLIKIRKSLEEKGFIKWKPAGQGAVGSCMILNLVTCSTDEQGCSLVEQGCSTDEQVRCSPNEQGVFTQYTGGCSSNEQACLTGEQGVFTKYTRPVHLVNISKEKNKDIKENTLRDFSSSNSEREYTPFDDVKEVFENSIHPIANMMEMEKLRDDFDHHGKDAVIEAIGIAAGRDALSLNYIEGVLRQKESERKKKEAEEAKKKKKDEYVLYGSHQHGPEYFAYYDKYLAEECSRKIRESNERWRKEEEEARAKEKAANGS